uniref:Uncharacterized protein n=1 Tax=Candidatus Kentrum sp. UNK TaxID=2126344 RepID=A0A451ATH6_9GAMM|nr:MAG: hypothetical protein BECKUNK1418G_GA0071005_13573 [Candidatus Kentron sp. UNK]VFK73879.1 MAG: hypothetical protein BECKUNK1418H_GA0071006_13403 [Candidatus Kentron sp. UNK]
MIDINRRLALPARPLPKYLGKPAREHVCRTVIRMVNKDGRDRRDIAEDMNDHLGEHIVTARTLTDWGQVGREDRNIPFWMVPALEQATRSRALSDWLIRSGGGQALWGANVLQAQLGAMEMERRRLDEKIEETRKQIEEKTQS